MDTSTVRFIMLILEWIFLIFTITIIIAYIILGIYSTIESIEYIKKNSFVNYKNILSSNFSPSISILAAAHNESLNIIENVRSLLSLHYANYEVIILNDGSEDDTLEQLIEAYDLVNVNYLINEQIETQPLRAGIFKSTNPAFEKLTVVDKENGGKADALNMGLNICESNYVISVDVDCLLLEDSLLKLIKPFLEATDKKIIAAGGVIRIANSCKIIDGKLIDVNLPKGFLEKFQILEYMRAFLLGRMAWSRLNGLLVISGAFGMFDKDIVIKVGGYDASTVGEDMELIVRMRRYMEEEKLKYKVAYIPDPLCWTEAPDNLKTLVSQRNRWTRGTIETLRKHRKIGLNPKYHRLGLVSMPYWFTYERMAPIIEVLGIIYFIILISLNQVRWDYVLAFFVFAYTFTINYSVLSIISEDLSFHQYKKKGTASKLFLIALLEPFIFHPVILYSAISGNIDYFFNKDKRWGKMQRKGLVKHENNHS